jgi:hypothetical protein
MLPNRSHFKSKLIVWLAVVICCLHTTVWAERGRPHVNPTHSTLVADNGNLLRGIFVTTEDGGLPSRERLQAIKNYGFNAVHCYAECAADGNPAGTQSAALDKLVQWTREDGLYLIITIGNCEAPIDAKFNAAFWKFYAGRYANEKHVIYEIQNEPAKGPGLSEDIINLEKTAYEIIRERAPETPVLLFSYMAFDNGPKVVKDILALGWEIDWSRTAIGFHGYGPGGRNACRKCLQFVLDAGYPCFQTEFYTWPWGKGMRSFISPRSWYQDVDETGDFERMGVSWLTFMGLTQAVDDTRFKDRLIGAGILWKPDYGNWPDGIRSVHGNRGEPWSVTNLTGKLHLAAADYDDGGQGISYNFATQTNDGDRRAVVALSTSDWVEYTTYITYPGTYDLKLHLSSSSPSGTNRMQISFGGRDVTGVWNLSKLDSSNAWTTVSKIIHLSPGQQVMRLKALDGTIKFDWLELAPANNGLVPDGIYKIANRDNHEMLTVPIAATNGARVFLEMNNARDNQLWRVRHLGANEYQISNLKNKKTLDVLDHERRNGSRVILWDNAGTLNQRWIITPTDGGFYNLVAAHSGLCLDVRDYPKSMSNSVCQFERNGNARQQWALQQP